MQVTDETSGWEASGDVVQLAEHQKHWRTTKFSTTADGGQLLHRTCTTSCGSHRDGCVFCTWI